MNSELTRKALEKVGNPHVLVNLVSRRVRQLNGGGGGYARPLVEVGPTMGIADIALSEIIEEKITVEFLNEEGEVQSPAPVAPKRRRRAAATAA